MPTQLTKVRTEVRFTAEDPWNGYRRCTFTLDNYIITLRNTKRLPERVRQSPRAGGFHRALHSEADGVGRFLPDSLIEIWLTGQASTEALPGLLKQMEPSLRQSDYRPILRSMTMKVFAVLETLCCTALVMIAIIAVVLGEAPLLMATAVVLGTALLCCIFLYLVYFGKLFRRKRQMRWLLARIDADCSAPATQGDVATNKPTFHIEGPANTSVARLQPARESVCSLFLADTDASVVLSKLGAGYSELGWLDVGEGLFGKIRFAGKGREKPSEVCIHLLCKDPPGRLTLTIRLEPNETAPAKADALKARFVQAVVATMPQPQPWEPFYTHGGNLERWASPPALSQQPKEFNSEWILDVPSGMLASIEPKLTMAFPELAWQGRSEDGGKVFLQGMTRESPQRAVLEIVRPERPDPLKLWIAANAPDRLGAEKSHQAIISWLESALPGSSHCHLPKFKGRPPAGIDIDQEEIVELQLPVDGPHIMVWTTKVDIFVSQILLQAISVYGWLCESDGQMVPRAGIGSDELEKRDARRRGKAARHILAEAVPSGSGEFLQLPIFGPDARSLIGSLLELGLAEVLHYGSSGRRDTAISFKSIKVHYFGNRALPTGGCGYIAFGAANSDAPNCGEFLRIDWWKV